MTHQHLQLFQLLFEHAADAHLLIAGDSMVECNAAAVALLGYPNKQTLLATRPSRFSADPQPDGRSLDTHLAELNAIVARNGRHRFEWLHVRADGSPVPVEVSLTEVPLGDQVVAHAVLRDITRRKNQERALQSLNRELAQSRDTLSSLFDSFDDGLLLLDDDGRVAMVNRALVDLLNSAPERMSGRRWANLARRIAPGFPHRQALDTIRDGQPRKERIRYGLPNGQVRVLDLHSFPLGQRHAQVVLRVIDVTDQLQLEALAMQHERFAANARLAAAVAHEIKSPLQAIQTLLYLAEGEATVERNQYLTLAREELVRLGQIVDRLTDHYRPSASSMAPLDLNTLVERVLLLTGGLLSRSNIVISRQLAPALPLAWGRSDQLTQVLLNLVFNAADAMPQGGTLQICTRYTANPQQFYEQHTIYWTQADDEHPLGTAGPQHEVALIEVHDSGRGIDPEILPRLCSPFVTTKPNGLGLGLAVSRRLMVQHQGALGISSSPEIGSSFIVALPLAEHTIHTDTYIAQGRSMPS
jgi:PAS domain S-box-containing protein